MRYSLQLREVNLAGKRISKNLNGKYSQKFLDNAEQSAADTLKTTSKRVTQKAAGNQIGNRIGDRIINLSKSSQQNNSETFKNYHNK